MTILNLTDMDILLTLPSSFARYISKHKKDFPSFTAVYSDPEDHKLGSGGGTVNVIWQHDQPGRRIIVHSDGQSRRLPAYGAVGKAFIPFPVFRWSRGQRIDQTLFDIQRPFLEKILKNAPEGQDTLIASGDALVWADSFHPDIPEADVVCLGVWAHAEAASKHGVFVVSPNDPGDLVKMLQKPGVNELQMVAANELFLLDTGIWLLSRRAVDFLFRESGWDPVKKAFRNGSPGYYDLYSELGRQLGQDSWKNSKLTVRIIPLDHAEFYHFGSNTDLLNATKALHERVSDQRGIWHKKIKPTADIFVQNAHTGVVFDHRNSSVWIENACIPASWTIRDHHILTGVPANEWEIDLPSGLCLDFIPVERNKWCIRPYGFYDTFKGKAEDRSTSWMNQPVIKWFDDRGFAREDLRGIFDKDIYECPLFPILEAHDLDQDFLGWLLSPDYTEGHLTGEHRKNWLNAERLSACGIISATNHARVVAQRRENLRSSLPALALNRDRSIFYQLDLDHLAGKYRSFRLPDPPPLLAGAGTLTRVHDLMFRSCLAGKKSKERTAVLEKSAFLTLRDGMMEKMAHLRLDPVLNSHHDQIIWGRSPVRFDLAGGWTDTPPYCLINGGKVVNMAVELNGQPPIQVFIRPVPEPVFIVRSVDLGVSETVSSYEELEAVNKVGSAFSIPKAALMLAGFHPDHAVRRYKTLREQLNDFGGGLDISLMVAVPKGSGLGTSSILAATLLGGLSEICSHHWSRHEICYRTLVLEQLLTTGGGWQDQFGGIYEGVKFIESNPGLVQQPVLNWAPDHFFIRPESKDLVLLYYTGITRVAKSILAEIVKGMFLNSGKHLEILAEMKSHAVNTYETIRKHDWQGLTRSIAYSWELNNLLDAGTNPLAVAAILHKIGDYADGYKLLGAGGGGYLMIFAKDRDAAGRIRKILETDPPNPGARFVEWELSSKGLEITKS